MIETCIYFERFDQFSVSLMKSVTQATSSIVKMEKFKVLKYHDFVLNKLIIYPFTSHFILVDLTAFIVLNAVFVYQNTSQFDAVLGACIFIFGIGQSVGMFFCYAINLSEIQTVHMEIQKIIDKLIEGMISLRKPMIKLSNAINITKIFRFVLI